MEYIKERIGLAPLTSPDQIDANNSPHEWLNDFKNIAPLGTLTSPTRSACPPAYLLEVPEPSPDRLWLEDTWSYYFSPRNPDPNMLDLMITFPRPVRLAEIQIFCGGEMDACPSKLTVEVEVNENDEKSMMEPPISSYMFGSLQGSFSGTWVWIQLLEPQFVQVALLRISKPENASFVHLAQIQLLEKRVEKIEEDLFLETILKQPHLLRYCQSALKDLPKSETLMARIVAIILHFEKNPDLTESGIDESSWSWMNTLTGPVLQKLSSKLPYQPQVNAVAGLIHDLCCLPNERGPTNLAAGLRWLEDLIDSVSTDGMQVKRVEQMNKMYTRALSAGLWSVAAAGKGGDFSTILTPQLLQKLFAWTMKLKTDEEFKMKAVVDYLICSMCYCRPWLYVALMYSMDLLKVKEGIELDDDCIMTDLFENWYNEHEGSLWTNLVPNELKNSKQQFIDLTCLETLGRATQSPTSAEIIRESPLLKFYNLEILEFCKNYGHGAVENEAIVPLIEILRFYRSLTYSKDLRKLIGEMLGRDFWLPVLNSVDSRSPDTKKLGSAIIEILIPVCWTNNECQEKIIQCIKEVISKKPDLSPFSRKLLVELLLDDPWFRVRIQSEYNFKMKNAPVPGDYKAYHPSFGVNGRDSIIFVHANTTAQDIVKMIEVEGCGSSRSDLTLTFVSCPDVHVPLHLPVRTLIEAAEEMSESRGQIPFLGMLELSLSKKKRQGQSDSDEDVFNVTNHLQPSLEVFAQNGGLIMIFERFNPKTCIMFSLSSENEIIGACLNFLRLPQYSEVILNALFTYRTNCLIRLMLGVTDDEDGEDILTSSVYKTLERLPFEALNWLLEKIQSDTDLGRNLRPKMVDNKSIHLVLDSMKGLTPTKQAPGASTNSNQSRGSDSTMWTKGMSTGYGMGPYPQDYAIQVEEALERKQAEEERTICLLNVINNFIDVDVDQSETFLAEVYVLLRNSPVMSVVSGYLRNDWGSQTDMVEHVPLCRTLFQFLGSVASTPPFWPLLVSVEGGLGILDLLKELERVATTYSRLLQASKIQDLHVTQLILDIQATVAQVEGAAKEFIKGEKQKTPLESGSVGVSSPVGLPKSLENRYVEEMRKIQFAFQEMIVDGQVFTVPYHYESEAKKNWADAGQRIHSRAKRLAQEAITLFTSLPLSYGSSIFLRCDNQRLDVMKVLITGPAGTPYSNGCFEFDIHFPLNYPDSPPSVNFETSRAEWMQFNPNLYSDGKVRLSILNTSWDGGPEEKWNPKTSSLLSVLVAIQSLILVDEPYWNEPCSQNYGRTGLDKWRSMKYNDKIRYFTLKYAILEQIRNPSSCFKEVILRHFWMKKDEILEQCKEWEQMSADVFRGYHYLIKNTASSLKSALLEMSPPAELEDLKFSIDSDSEDELIPDPLSTINDTSNRSRYASVQNLPHFSLKTAFSGNYSLFDSDSKPGSGVAFNLKEKERKRFSSESPYYYMSASANETVSAPRNPLLNPFKGLDLKHNEQNNTMSKSDSSESDTDSEDDFEDEIEMGKTRSQQSIDIRMAHSPRKQVDLRKMLKNFPSKEGRSGTKTHLNPVKGPKGKKTKGLMKGDIGQCIVQ